MRTPAQLAAARSQSAKELEEKIDSAIDAAGVLCRTVATVQIGSFAADVVEHVMADYRRHGWRAIRVSDSRDGDFIQLEPQP